MKLLEKIILYIDNMERWLSGLKRTLGKCVNETVRGFEPLSPPV